MTVVVLATKHDSIVAVREALGAASGVSPQWVELWLVGISTEEYQNLPVDRIRWLEDSGSSLAQRYISSVLNLWDQTHPQLVLCPGSLLSSELAMLVSSRKKINAACQITGLEKQSQGIVIRRPVLGYQLDAAFLYAKPPWIFTLQLGCFSPAVPDGKPVVCKEQVVFDELPWLLNYREMPGEKQTDWNGYFHIFVGGRGMGSRKQMERLERLGESLDAGVGATRPAVLDSWCEANRMLGVSGASVAPEVCVTLGVSGSTPFRKGVEKSKEILAINQNPDALIFQHCDLGITGDCHEAITILEQLSQKNIPQKESASHE